MYMLVSVAAFARSQNDIYLFIEQKCSTKKKKLTEIISTSGCEIAHEKQSYDPCKKYFTAFCLCSNINKMSHPMRKRSFKYKDKLSICSHVS